MVAALGVEALRLVRVAVGPLQLGKLAKGDWRRLTTEEKLAIDRAMGDSGPRTLAVQNPKSEIRT
jgi:23S rRNA pseudouridine2605 synthase